MNILKNTLLKTIMVCAFCSFAIVSGFSGAIIEEDIMRVASDSGAEIEEITVVNQDTGESTTYRMGGVVNKCEIDISTLKNGCYVTYVKTKGGVVEVSVDCKITRE